MSLHKHASHFSPSHFAHHISKQFFKDTDGTYAANVRLYNSHQFPEGLASRSKVRAARSSAAPPTPPLPHCFHLH